MDALLFRVERHERVESTNSEVKRAIDAGMPEGFAAFAFEQTAGYGRQGRPWSSPVGGIYESLLLRPSVPVRELPAIGLVAALAAREAIARSVGEHASHVQVKWPNDVVCPQGKLCGISVEAHAGALCIGIGVNVFEPPVVSAVPGKNVPAYVAALAGDGLLAPSALAGRPELEASASAGDGPLEASTSAGGFGLAASALDADQRAALIRLGDAILRAFEARYRRWCDEGFSAFSDEFRRRSSLTGARVEISSISGALQARGAVEGIDDDGRLLLRTEEGLRAISSGEAHIAAIG